MLDIGAHDFSSPPVAQAYQLGDAERRRHQRLGDGARRRDDLGELEQADGGQTLRHAARHPNAGGSRPWPANPSMRLHQAKRSLGQSRQTFHLHILRFGP
jgi:hypothetical protein